MADSLRQRLRRSRRSHFVGRQRERDLFRETLDAEVLPYHLVYVHGPGGIGKTSLLEEVRAMAEARAFEVARLDARDLSPTPAAVSRAVTGAFADADPEARRVLLIDTYEGLAPIDDWLRRTFLPELPGDTLVVLAGRLEPAVGWRTDPGWRSALAVLPLRNLSAEESEAFLEAEGIEGASRDAARAFTHGHPLGLALVVDHVRLHPDRPFDAAEAPDVVGALLSRFVQDETDPRRRLALEAASLVRSVTEPLLQALLGGDEAHAAFAWLRSLSFMEVGARGLWPHDLAREVIRADLRWRDPDRFADLHARARRYYTAQLHDPAPQLPQTLADYAFLYRDNPIVRPFFAQLREAWQQAGSRAQTDLGPGDRDALIAMVRRHEGEASADHFARWADRQPGGVEVFRDAAGGVRGFLLAVALERATPEERAADPVAEAAWETAGAIREGERVLLFRHWMDADAHQGVSAVQSLVFAATVRQYLATPGLAVSVLATHEPDLWGPVLGFAGLSPAGHADGVALFSHDWRAEPPAAWLEGLAARTPQATAPPPRTQTPLVVLSRDGFEEAVREALRAYARPYKLRASPLLASRLVRSAAPEAEDDTGRIHALRDVIAEAAALLDASPREAPYGRALRAAYLQPSPTQHLAAERVGVPFSTFRRHLGRGMDHVVEELWRRETAV